uniref:DNA topoisomerase n=1 Tax=Panagrellus redivivus TaxID=6233 RepID=A0A7E4V7V4_PANRE
MSSDVYALLDSEATVYLFKQCRVSVVIDDAPTLEGAVKALRQAAPPKTIKGVYILSFSQFEHCRNSVEAVQKAGYTIIELVETIRFCISSFIYNLPLKQTIGSVVFVVADSKGQTPIAQSKFTVFRKCEKGWQFVQTFQTPFDALADYPSVTEVVFPQNVSETDKTMLKLLFPSLKLHASVMDHSGWLTTFFQNRINNGNLNGYEVQQFCPFDVLIKYGTDCVTVPLEDTPPFTITKDIDVGDVHDVEIRASAPNVAKKSLIKTFKFKSVQFRTVSITINVDKTLLPRVSLKTIAARESDATLPSPAQNGTSDGPPKAIEVPRSHGDSVDKTESTTTLPTELSQLQLDPSPTTILTFTSDNRVLINAGKTYAGVKEVPAYVRLQSGMAPEVGQKAFDALKEHPDSVFYDITRLLATDFDSAHPDPSWRFNTSRGGDGKVLVRGGNNITTFPIVLFGLVVNSTLKYIKEHQKSEVTELGIRLPSGSVISDTDLKDVAQRIGVKLLLLDE